ncbi:MAG: hypothetical protein IK063_00715 [Clostridia bacterium]|nr:hypothetical protein [Clostridia bacterium]
MKRLLLLIPLFVIIFLSCALFRTRQQIKTQSETTTQTAVSAADTTSEVQTTAHGVLDRLFGKDQEASTTKKQKKKAKKSAGKESQSGEETTSAGTTVKKGGMLSKDELELIEELGINLDNITEKKTTEIKMSLGDGVITETTSIKEAKPVTTRRNSSGGSTGSGGPSAPAPETRTDKEILASGKYAMQATVKRNSGSPVSFRIYADGSRYALFTNISLSDDDTVAVEVLLNDNDVLFVVPKLKAYIDGGRADDYKFKNDVFDTIINPVKETAGGQGLVDTAVVTLGGREYTVEEYKTENGQTVKYYIYNEKAERIEFINSDGNSIILEISSLSDNVPSDSFTVPSGYVNMTKAAGKHIDFLKEKSIF